MILVTGAGGKTGRTVTKWLSKAAPLCALVHREEQVSVLKSLGAERVVVGDLGDESAVRGAMQGVRAVYHICPNMNPDETAIGKLVIGAARENGVEHFVYHSVLHPQAEKMPHHWAKLRVEELLLESGLAFTVLQPAPYMQNLLAAWSRIVEDGVLGVPYSVDSKFSFADLEDIAECGKIVLTEPGHTNATYELAGTVPLSHVEVAETFSRVLNRNVHAEKEEIAAWRLRTLKSSPMGAGPELSAYAVENLVRMFEYYDQWGLTGNPNVLAWLLGRGPTSLESFIARAVKERDVVH
jgi:uncharacterized protein YbjT (DUF2867 family)